MARQLKTNPREEARDILERTLHRKNYSIDTLDALTRRITTLLEDSFRREGLTVRVAHED